MSDSQEPVAHKRPLIIGGQPSVLGDPADPWSYHKKTVPADIPVRLLPQLVQLANSEDPKDQLQGTLLIRKLLCVSENPPIDQVVASQVLPRLISFLLRDDYVDLQFESAWAVTDVASAETAHTHYVVEQGAVPHFIRLLASPSDEIREKATWALGNIAGDSATCRDHVLGHGVMAPLLQCIMTPAENVAVTRNGVWVVANLCRSKPNPDLDTVCQALPVIVPLLDHHDDEIMSDACWALAYISDGPPTRVERVLNCGALPRIIPLLNSDRASQQTPALHLVGNIAAGSEEQRHKLLTGGVLPTLHSPLRHPRRSVRKETLRALANFTSSAPEHIQAVLDEGLFPAVLECIATAEFDVKQEAVQCIANCCSHGTPKQVRHVVEELNVFKYVVPVLEVSDAKILKTALAATEQILESGDSERQRCRQTENPYAKLFTDNGGTSKLEVVATSRSDSDASSGAADILRSFFGSSGGGVSAK